MNNTKLTEEYKDEVANILKKISSKLENSISENLEPKMKKNSSEVVEKVNSEQQKNVDVLLSQISEISNTVLSMEKKNNTEIENAKLSIKSVKKVIYILIILLVIVLIGQAMMFVL